MFNFFNKKTQRIRFYNINKRRKRILIKKKGNYLINFFLIITISIVFLLIPIGIFGIRFYNNIILKLPPIENLNSNFLAQTSVITDRNGIILYKLFEENRKYISFEEISPNMINAIVAIEDKNFWTNPGIDIYGMIRAFVHDITNLGSSIHGGSTLTQQLIKNELLTNDRNIERKLKEIVLSIKINSFIQDELSKKYKGLNSEQLDRKSKEKILELYLNRIFFGNNSFGVQAASETYFGTSATNLTILQSSILASIPKGPSKYNPISNKNGVLGYILIEDKNGNQLNNLSGDIKSLLTKEFIGKLKESKKLLKDNSESFIDLITNKSQFQMNLYDSEFNIKYIVGRKDFVLGRLYEDKYIDNEKLFEAFIDGLDFKFNNQKINILAPHFVFYVIDELKKTYGDEILMKGGLTIKTSLDINIQNIAQDSINQNMQEINENGGSNSALIYIDSKNGDILAYVGSSDYYNEEIDGKVDIITSLRQPGSTIKPILYSLGFMKHKLTIDSPIYDIPIEIGKNKPQNVDGKFLGMMAIKNALAYSRNIPAIMMYFAVGEESEFRSFLKNLGIESLRDDLNYGYPMAIGGAEIKLFELAKLYSHLSALGTPAKINPILEIRNSDSAIIYKKKIVFEQQVIPSGVAYMIWDILSNKSNLPPTWVKTFSYNNLKLAGKSGTTNVVDKNNNKLPRDGLLSVYTPSKVLVMWVGNANGQPMKSGSFGGWLNEKTRKNFFKGLDEKGILKNEEMNEKEVKKVNISKLNGNLASDSTPFSFIINSLGYIDNIPNNFDSSKYIKIDKLCGGSISENTPENSIENYLLLNYTFELGKYYKTEQISNRWNNVGLNRFNQNDGIKILLEEPKNTCIERLIAKDSGTINIKILNPSEGSNITNDFSIFFEIISPFEVENVKIYIDGMEWKSYNYLGKGLKNFKDLKDLRIPLKNGNIELKIVAQDSKGYSSSDTKKFKIGKEDSNGPFIIDNKINVQEKKDGSFNVSMMIFDNESKVKGGKISQNGKLIKEFNGNSISFDVNDLSKVEYELYDIFDNISKGEYTF